MKAFFSLALLLFCFSINAQVSAFVGTFNGTINGDNVTMNLQKSSDNSLVGKMKDSQQNYDVKATVNGSQLTGTAVEKTLNLTFFMNGQLSGSQLKMKMTIEILGQKQDIDVLMIKVGAAAASTKPLNSSSNTPSTAVKFPSGATNDRNIVGTWVKTENYNSGSGDNFMGSSFQQKMIFFADGTVADGGSQANISGSNYSGSSQGGAQATPGIYWYNINNQLYLLISQNGKTETAHLGRYYIENGAMLITGTNGKKLLLTRR